MLQDYLRRRSLFQPSPEIGMHLNVPDIMRGDNSSRTSEVDDTPDTQDDRSYGIGDVYNKLLAADTPPAQKKYKDFLDSNAPRREDFKPNKISKIGAILAGISEGEAHGGAAGYKASSDILDSPFNEAVSDYKFQGDRLAKAADIEEKDVSNRVKTYRDILQDVASERRDKENHRLNDARILDFQSRAKDRAETAKSRGWNFFNDETTGKRSAVRPNGTGSFDRLDLGGSVLSPTQKVDLAGKEAGAKSNATLANDLKIISARGEETRKSTAARFKNVQELVDYKKNKPNYSQVVDDKGDIVLIDKSGNNDHIYTGIATGKLSDTDKAALGLKNAKNLKASPSAPTQKTTTTTVSEDGKTKTTKTNTGEATSKVKMIDPDGNEFMVDPKEVDEALTHKWKVKKG
jgi:hypothetical protein